jgi:hypothetical protein
MAERLCAHEPCHCEPEAGAEFCAAACAGQAHSARGGDIVSHCPCGHAECRPEHVSPDQPLPATQS